MDELLRTYRSYRRVPRLSCPITLQTSLDKPGERARWNQPVDTAHSAVYHMNLFTDLHLCKWRSTVSDRVLADSFLFFFFFFVGVAIPEGSPEYRKTECRSTNNVEKTISEVARKRLSHDRRCVVSFLFSLFIRFPARQTRSRQHELSMTRLSRGADLHGRSRVGQH